MRKTPTCKTCGGTGWIYARNSMFRSDGYSRLRCGICKGSGEHAFRADPDYAQFQEQARKEMTAKRKKEERWLMLIIAAVIVCTSGSCRFMIP
jgi:hypothetical protein